MSTNPQDPLYNDDEPQGMLARILPPLVLICAFGGFVALAIYAYKAGTQSVSDGELMVVEADSAPVKEKPENPGGMQFPNQDKTIFETFSTGGNQPKVERVLPTPEEPIAQENTGSEPTTFVNKEQKGNSPVTAEQVFGDEDAPPVKTEEAPAAVTPEKVEAQVDARVKNVREELGKQAVEAPVEVPAAEVAEVAKPVELAKTEAKIAVVEKQALAAATKPVVKKVEKTAPAKAGSSLVQLGAFKSDAEAKSEFVKMQKKNQALAGKKSSVVRADLGDKGIFYRLRVSTDDAKALCAKLAANKQACMAVK